MNLADDKAEAAHSRERGTRGTSPDLRAILCAILAVIAWGAGPLTVKAVTAPAAATAAYRMALGAPLFWVTARALGRRVTWNVVRYSIVPGTLFSGCILVGFASFRNTSIAAATLIPALLPAVMLCVAPRLFGERPSIFQVALALLSIASVAGVVLSSGQSTGTTTNGNLLAVMNLALFSAYWVAIKRARAQGVDSWAMLSAMFAIGAGLLVPYGFVVGADMRSIGGSDWAALSIMLVVPGLVGHGLMTWSSKHLQLTVSSLLTVGSPVVSIVGAWAFYSESLNPVQVLLIGVAIGSLAATLMATRSSGVVEP